MNFPVLFRQVDLHKLASSTFTHAFKVFSFLCTLLKLEVISKALCSLEPVTYEKGLVQLLRHCCDALNIIFVGWAKWTLYGSPLPLEFAPLIAVGETYLPSGWDSYFIYFLMNSVSWFARLCSNNYYWVF